MAVVSMDLSGYPFVLPRFFLIESPRISIRWALCTSRSRIPSARVGSPTCSCQRETGSWEVRWSSAPGSGPRRSPRSRAARVPKRSHHPVIDHKHVDAAKRANKLAGYHRRAPLRDLGIAFGHECKVPKYRMIANHGVT